MDVLRTAAGCFTGFKEFASKQPVRLGISKNYADRSELNADVVLMLHGEPNRRFRYRLMIPAMSKAGIRVMAFDLFGAGNSFNSIEIHDYSFVSQVKWVLALISALDLRDISLVLPEQGALLGLRLAAEHPQLFSSIILTKDVLPNDIACQMFRVWKRASTKWKQVHPIIHTRDIGSEKALTDVEVEAFKALLFRMSLIKWHTV